MVNPKFSELEALLAILDEDEDRLFTIIKSMLPGERRALSRAADRLSEVTYLDYHFYEPGEFQHREELTPNCRVCSQPKKDRSHLDE